MVTKHATSHPRRGHGLLLSVCAGASLAMGAAALAQDTPVPPSPAPPIPTPAPAEAPAEIVSPDVAPEAKEVLDRVAAFYKQLPGVQVTAKMSVKVPGEEGEAGQDTEISLAAADPNKFAFPLQTGGEFDEFKMVSTGETVYVFVGAPINKYEQKEAPPTYEGVIDAISMGRPAELESLVTPMYPVLALMAGQSLAEIPGVTRVEFVADEEVNGRPTSHLRFVGEQTDVDLWALKGDQPWLVQVKPDASKGLAELGELGEQLKQTMPQITVSFDQWESRAEFPEGTFAFTPPESAEKVASIMEAMQADMGGGEPGAQGNPHAALLGKPAPAFSLEKLGGGKASLEDAKGKVVMLDFWATWCPPCVRGLPVVSGLAEKYKDKGLAFYAVNQQEDLETINGFLEKRKLSLPVILDKDGAVASEYLVTGIPQTVLIGKDGTVQVVHVGFMPSMEEELGKQIEALLAGKDLAAETLAKEKAESEKAEDEKAEDEKAPPAEQPR